MREIVSKFEVKFGIPQAFGCIDGTYVPSKKPLINSQDFYNYKQFFSLIVQAVCDNQGRFVDVEYKWPGSVHDAKVLANSMICKINQTSLNLSAGYDTLPNCIIEGPAYPLIPYCIKKYQPCVKNKQVLSTIYSEVQEIK